MAEIMDNQTGAPEEITKKDVTKAYLRWHFANEIPHSFERYLAPSLLYGMMPILKKLYKDEDSLKAAYKRQLLFFNTQLSWGGGVITGLMSSMEQQRAEEEYEEKEILMQDDLMYNTKAGLMGALANRRCNGFRNRPIYFYRNRGTWAQTGSPLGALFPFICFGLYQVLRGVFFARQAFTMGRNATGLMQNTGVQTAIEMLSVLGLFMMGVLAGNYVKVESSLKFAISGREFVIQEILDRARDITFSCRNGCVLVLYEKRIESHTSIIMADWNINCASRNRYFIKRRERE